MHLNLDYETRSELDVSEVGAYKYARSAEILCAAYTFDDDYANTRVWRPWLDEPMPGDLRAAFADDAVEIHAWNAQFERLISAHCLRLNTEIRLERWRCTAARARASAFPGKLELCARALNIIEQKDMAGNRLMLKWTQPLKNGGWADDPEEYGRLVAYCAQDVRVEAMLGKCLRDMTAEEWLDYHNTERLNDRGIPVDLALATAATGYAKVEAAEINQALSELTNGEITTAKQFQRIKNWVAARAPDVMERLKDPETEKVSLDKNGRLTILDDPRDTPDEVLQLFELVDDGGRASTSKFQAVLNRADADQRVRGAYLMNGAGQTGRFSAVGFQPHNLVRDKLKAVDAVVEAVLEARDAGEITALSGENLLTTLARLLRPMVVADEGKTLVWADYSAVEARALPWLSLEPTAEIVLDYFRQDKDPYIREASNIYGVSEAEILARYKADDTEAKLWRQIGKVAVLALGFQGGEGAFRKMARAYGIKIAAELAQMIKIKWRQNNPWAAAFWANLHKAAVSATRAEGRVFEAGRVSYLRQGSDLYCRLPCGRLLTYPDVRLEAVGSARGESYQLSALKGSLRPEEGTNVWPRVNLYGGIEAENVTQGICASLLRLADRDLEEAGWPVVMHTHDELMLEVFDDEIEEAKTALRQAMLRKRGWNDDLPLQVELGSGKVYGK